MVLLHLRTANANNNILAKFDSLYETSYVQFSNIGGNIYLGGLSNNQLRFFNSNNDDDRGLRYRDNTISVDNINCLNLKNGDVRIFPNPQTPLNNYELNEPSTITSFGCARCFDINDFTFWQSENVYSSINGFARTDTTIHKFENSYGHYIKIRFPYQIVPIGFSVNSVENYNDPLDFDVYGSLDEVRWTKIAGITQNNFTNVFSINNSNELKILCKPILILDSNIKVSDNSIYNIESINTKKLYLNDVPINSLTELNSNAIVSALEDFRKQYSYYWKNSNSVGFPDSNVLNKLSIGKTTAISTLDINGDIGFINRSISNKIVISTLTTPYSSPYISIGRINMKAINNRNYFQLKVFLVDTTKYYFQTINIYGYSFVEVNTNLNQINAFKLYWDTEFDDTRAIQRINDVVYIIDFGVEPIIKIYIKYNDLLDITFTQTISGTRDLFINHIFIDEIQTTSDNVVFIPATSIETLNLPNFTRAINIFSKNLNSNITYSSSNVFNYLSTSNLNISGVRSSNLLILDNNRNVIDTNVSFNIFSNLRNTSGFANKVACFDNNTSLNVLNINQNVLNTIGSAVNTNSQILITNNGNYEPLIVNRNTLSNLNLVSSNPNSILVIDANSNLRTTNTIDIANVVKIMSVFDFNFSNSYNHRLKINSNTNIDNISVNNNLYVGGHIISSNYKSNRLYVNNQEIGENIFRLIIKIPNNNDVITAINNSLPILNNIRKYIITLSSKFNISLEVDENDDDMDITNIVYNLFNKFKFRRWKTQNNFLDYRAFYNVNAFKYLYNDTSGITKCGAYVIIDLGQPFVLNFYALYVRYDDFKTSIRDFKIFGLKGNVWVLVDDRRNVLLNNDVSPNVFILDTNKYDVFDKLALCIINTHNDTGIPNFCVLNYIELYGYIPTIANYNYSNLTFNFTNNPFLFGTTYLGISNINPLVPLSIGNDLSTNSTEALFNLNHMTPTSTANLEKPIINITRPSLSTTGVKAVHYLNSWYESNTNYTFKLTHSNTTNERIVLSMNSDGRVGIGTHPFINDCNNGLSIYNNGLSLSNNISTITNNRISNNSLIVSGSIYTTVDITTDSDISYKYNIQVIDNPLDKLKQIRGYTFNRNDVIGDNDERNKRYTGLIAQEVLKVVPEAVIKKHDGKLRILYTNLAGLFVEGIREINEKYDYLNFKFNLLSIMCLMILVWNFYKTN